MTNQKDRLKAFLTKLHAFYEEREWKQFHFPKNLAMGVASEAGELLQIFRFLTEAESSQLGLQTLELVQDEIGDVFIFLVYLADTLGMDAIELAERKFARECFQKILPLGLCQSPGVETIGDGDCIELILSPSPISQLRELSHQPQGQNLLKTLPKSSKKYSSDIYKGKKDKAVK